MKIDENKILVIILIFGINTKGDFIVHLFFGQMLCAELTGFIGCMDSELNSLYIYLKTKH